MSSELDRELISPPRSDDPLDPNYHPSLEAQSEAYRLARRENFGKYHRRESPSREHAEASASLFAMGLFIGIPVLAIAFSYLAINFLGS